MLDYTKNMRIIDNHAAGFTNIETIIFRRTAGDGEVTRFLSLFEDRPVIYVPDDSYTDYTEDLIDPAAIEFMKSLSEDKGEWDCEVHDGGFYPEFRHQALRENKSHPEDSRITRRANNHT